MGDFDGKTALVTGGSSGIGRATALAFAAAGARVVIGDLDVERGEQVVGMIRDGGEASFVRTDVSVETEMAALVEHAVTTYGRLDVAFNNAGIDGDPCSLVEHTEENFQAVMDVNVKGVWLSMKHQIPRLIEEVAAAVVWLCSDHASFVTGHCLAVDGGFTARFPGSHTVFR